MAFLGIAPSRRSSVHIATVSSGSGGASTCNARSINPYKADFVNIYIIYARHVNPERARLDSAKQDTRAEGKKTKEENKNANRRDDYMNGEKNG